MHNEPILIVALLWFLLTLFDFIFLGVSTRAFNNLFISLILLSACLINKFKIGFTLGYIIQFSILLVSSIILFSFADNLIASFWFVTAILLLLLSIINIEIKGTNKNIMMAGLLFVWSFLFIHIDKLLAIGLFMAGLILLTLFLFAKFKERKAEDHPDSGA